MINSSCTFDKTRIKLTKQVNLLIFFVDFDKLIMKGGITMKDVKHKQVKQPKTKTESIISKSLKEGDKKLNGPNIPST
jgi:hypothetical protein